MPSATFNSVNDNDDAYEHGDGVFDWLEPDNVVLSYDPATDYMYQCAGYRFLNITVPKGCVVTAAKLKIYVQKTSTDDIDCKIYGNLVANAENFEDHPHIISEVERPRTTEYVSWVADALGVGWTEKIGLEGIINEILALADWTSGNAIVLLFIAGTHEYGKVMCFLGVEGGAPAELEIIWLLLAGNPLISKLLVSPIVAIKPTIW